MQQPSTGDMTDPYLSAKPGETPQKTAERKGQILWQPGEIVMLAAGTVSTMVSIAEIRKEKKQLVVDLYGNGPTLDVGDLYTAKGMDWRVISHEPKDMSYVIQWIGKTAGLEGLAARARHGSREDS